MRLVKGNVIESNFDMLTFLQGCITLLLRYNENIVLYYKITCTGGI